ncbi:hypothetical protein DFH29DRAFT_893423 [Suillus ampliporus]|nr:hypothetical protein DFH29DRAFT_893423 [Suillus ampliporus]
MLTLPGTGILLRITCLLRHSTLTLHRPVQRQPELIGAVHSSSHLHTQTTAKYARRFTCVCWHCSLMMVAWCGELAVLTAGGPWQ